MARELSPTLVDIGRLAPEAEGFFKGLGPVIDSAPSAFPAFRRLFRDDFPPLLRSLDPFVRSLNPIVKAIGAYRHELSALVANAAATTNGVSLVKGRKVHYLRTLSLLNPESVATYPRSAADQPQPRLLGAEGLLEARPRARQLRRHASARPGSAPSWTRRRPTDPAFTARTDGDVEAAQDFFDRLRLFAFDDQLATDAVPDAAELRQAGRRSGPTGPPGTATDYPHVLEQAP